jgi:hypothetical protein
MKPKRNVPTLSFKEEGMTKSTAGVSQRIWARAGNEITRYLTIACAVAKLEGSRHAVAARVRPVHQVFK